MITQYKHSKRKVKPAFHNRNRLACLLTALVFFDPRLRRGFCERHEDEY